jgi:hypothetical protein
VGDLATVAGVRPALHSVLHVVDHQASHPRGGGWGPARPGWWAVNRYSVGDWVVFACHYRLGPHRKDPPIGTVGRVIGPSGEGGWLVSWPEVQWSSYQGDYQIRLATPEEIAGARLVSCDL